MTLASPAPTRERTTASGFRWWQSLIMATSKRHYPRFRRCNYRGGIIKIDRFTRKHRRKKVNTISII